MIARVLPREEWSRLAVTGFPLLGSTLRPEDSEVVVIEDEGRIVASMGTFRVTHFESLWIAPEYRGNAGLARRLMKAGVKSAKKWADEWVWGTSGTDHMNGILERVGGEKMPVDSFAVPLK